jgi:hypothetical protein
VITASVFKARLDQLKANIRNWKYFSGSTLKYSFHVIEYQYCGLPHAHLVIRLTDAPDIDNPDKDALINFVNEHFIAEGVCVAIRITQLKNLLSAVTRSAVKNKLSFSLMMM